MSESIVGSVYSVVYNSDDYYILNFDEGDRNVKAKGNVYGLIQLYPGVPIQFVGKWERNQKFGREFHIQTWKPWAEDDQGVRNFLRLCIDGFNDYKIVDAVVGHYGLNTFEELTKNPKSVLEVVADVGAESLERAVLGWERALAQRDLSALLTKGGLGSLEIQAAMALFGMDAAKVVAENPFRLMEVPGIPFLKVDKLAGELGVGPNDPRRIRGAVLWALQEASKQGHLYLPKNELQPQVSELLLQQENLRAPLPLGDEPAKAYNGAVLQLVKSKAVVFDQDAGIYLPSLYRFERMAADLLSKLLVESKLDLDHEVFLSSYERANKIQLSEAQRHAILLLLTHGLVVITGLPGTGKTTVLRAVVRLLEEAKLDFHLMAPTGIAAKRLSSVTGHEASTIHRALKFDGKVWGLNESNRFITDAVVLDEASMMDQELLYRLLAAIRPGTRLVLVGDDAQLPSVGPGNVLRELLDCAPVPHVRLTEIFRQSVKGEIVTSSHKINSGKMPDLSANNTESEFRFVRLSDEEEIVRLIVAMAVKLKARDSNFQVLSPKYEGVVGVDNLNEKLRDALNPEGPMEFVKGQQRFRRGDRLMVVQNDYDLGVYNGDVGKLWEIGREGVVVKIHGMGDVQDQLVPFKSNVASTKLRLAYAITAHKSQGSEFDTIIMPIVKSQGRMLQRNLLYTAVTRAKKRVWLIGEETAIQKAVDNNKVVKRNTILSKAVQACLANVTTPQEAVNGEAR
jgi:exodeoxyribonuclease V alpha subunit